MTKTRPSVIGHGPELFGRGIDLLFGEAEETMRDPDDSASIPLELGGGTPAEAVPLELGGAPSPASAGDPLEPEGGTFNPSGAPGSAPPQPIPGAVNAPSHPVVVTDASADSHPAELEESTMPALPQQPTHVAAPVTPQPTNGSAQAEVTPAENVSEPLATAVGLPGQGSINPELKEDLLSEDLEPLTDEQIKAISRRLHKEDLAALKKEVDRLYVKVSDLMSGNRREATVAFGILRKVRKILLEEPAQFAYAEYLARQVRARVNQIERSVETGKQNAPRIYAVQVIWLIVLAIFAVVTTVGSPGFTAWMGRFLGVPAAAVGSVDTAGMTAEAAAAAVATAAAAKAVAEAAFERLNWAILLLSTLAWGGIGGVTSALWSMYYHISIQRDYDPIDNVWYYSQPLLGMVLGGIVFLIMGAGFLVVQVDLSGTNAVLGARLLPAAVAVIIGFRQEVVLDLIERVIGLITPAKAKDSTLSDTDAPPAPPSEPI